MKPETIASTVQQWTADPAKAQVSPAVKARTDGAQAIIETGPFSWRTDLPPALGGENKAPSPTALALGALAGCAAVFIRDTLAPQLGVRVDSVEAQVRCRTDFRGLLGMAGAIPDLIDLELHVAIQSPEPEERIEAIRQAWVERCPVYLALMKPQQIRMTLERISATGEQQPTRTEGDRHGAIQ